MYYENKYSKTNHNTFGGEVYLSDFDGVTLKDAIDRTITYSNFDKYCKNPIIFKKGVQYGNKCRKCY